MELEQLLVGRQIWIVTKGSRELGLPAMVIDSTVTALRQFLPAGPVAEMDVESQSANQGVRSQHLVQYWEDRAVDKQGNELHTFLRTVAVANIRLTKPRVAGDQDDV